MIDTDKYTGHLMDGDFQVWSWSSKMLKVANYEEQMATAALLRDTPLLLEEVKRLRKGIKEAIQHLTYPAKYDREVEEQTDKLKELIG